MYSNFRKTPLALLSLAAIMLAGSLPQAGATTSAASPNANRISAGQIAEIRTIPLAASAPVSAYKRVDPYKIVAIGDSLTVGYEMGITEPSALYGYVGRIYEQALYHGAAEVQNFGVLGLKSGGLKNWLDAAVQGTTVAAEDAQSGLSKYPYAAETIAKSAALKEAAGEADLIVMTIGGNDFLPIFTELQSRTVEPAELQKLLDDLLAGYSTTLEASLRAIVSLNPDAKIVLADQYLPLPKPSQFVKVVTEEQYAVLEKAVSSLHDALETVESKFAGEGVSLSIVDIATPFAGQQFVLTSIRDKDVHPNNAGYEVIGQQFASAIWGEYRKAAPLAADVPLHLIVNGKELAGGNKPVIKNNTTFLPMRDVANALGATLAWDGKTQTATIQAAGKKVAFTIGAKTMNVNGQQVPLTTPAYLAKNGKNLSTYLPLAALSEGIGYQVVYRKTIKTAFIN
ncbi:stalk domain-containing protein [Paenibacillus methanolicus]|uniref:Lysophospholipase L1-like esterase n=1 Tax=Paenibacillus methanolicus TaxID=582686 RepID=A0A5S5BTC5_9BACL|nr:stalk domain-containing protein [Paenibacillus methanolicus]TYP70267.1 lysophospholipase L1-like esterase [Paenibacillus methanolicus]